MQRGQRERLDDSQSGSASAIAVGLIAICVLLAAALAAIGDAIAANQKARTAADQAALAAAWTYLNGDSGTGSTGAGSTGAGPHEVGAGTPCAAATALAIKNGGEVLGCRLIGDSAQVEVSVVSRLGRRASATARAGAPPGAGPATTGPTATRHGD